MELKKEIANYLENCRYMKGLSEKTIKAYSIDLKQYEGFTKEKESWCIKSVIEDYIKHAYINFKPRSARRKISSLKAFFHYLELEDILEINPFHKIMLKHKEPLVLPKTIPMNIFRNILCCAYENTTKEDYTDLQRKNAIRDVAVIELLFASGIRINELCNLKIQDVDLKNKIIKVNGKGSKERYIYITNQNVMLALKSYYKTFAEDIERTEHFFINNRGNKLSEQSARFMIKKYEKKTNSKIHITPHMFRHTVATLLLEEDVDIRYIQELLGHSSITTTQIYTHISMRAQKKILSKKHPRNKIYI